MGRILLTENDFEWRVPDPRVPDTIASFEVAESTYLQLVQGDEYKVMVPARAYVETDATPAISGTSSDVSDAAVSSTANTISFKLPQLAETKWYDITDIVEIGTVSGTTYTKLNYGTTAPAWSYDASTGTFTVYLTSAASVTLHIFYIPKVGNVKLVHNIPGAVNTNVLCAQSSTSAHVMYEPGRAPQRIQKNEVLGARTYLNIVVYPRTVAGEYKYQFNPLRVDNTISDIIIVEIPVERVPPEELY